MKKMAVVLVSILALFSLSACGNFSNDVDDNSFRETQVTLNDGRVVTCVVWMGYRKGGPSCDWANAK